LPALRVDPDQAGQGEAEARHGRHLEGAGRPHGEEPALLRPRAGLDRQPEQDELRGTEDLRLTPDVLSLPLFRVQRGVQPVARSRRRPPWWVALVALVALSTGLRAWAALDLPTPWIAPDEMVYGLLGQSLYRSGSLDILGGPTPYYSLVVPAFTGLPLSLGNLDFGYQLLKVLQALAMSLTAVPVYLWGRTLVDRRWAFVAAVLTGALPGLVYSGLGVSEG